MRDTDKTARFGEPARRRSDTPGFGRVGALLGTAVVLFVLGTVAWSAVTGAASPARHPQVFGGSLVLDDASRPLTVIDLATGGVTVRLKGVNTQVGAATYADVQAIPVSSGTMLVNRATGAFNLLGHDDYAVDTTGSGVGLGSLKGATSATGYADGAAAYIVRHAPVSTVSLVDRTTVEAGAQSAASGSSREVTPRGFAALAGSVPDRAGAAVVAGRDLWALVSTPGGGCDVVQLHPVSTGQNGLAPTTRRSRPGSCDQTVLEQSDGSVAAVTRGQAVIWPSAGPARTVPLTATRDAAAAVVPISDLSGGFWFLVPTPDAWLVSGMNLAGQPEPARAIRGLSALSDPVPPLYAAGHLYTLDRAPFGQPRLLVIDPATGAVSGVRGIPAYPVKSATEQADFSRAEVIRVGPRVVFNNPQSLMAVVVFTDGSHHPVTVDKSTAVDVSPVGPGDVSAKPTAAQSPAAPAAAPTPAAAAVSQQLNCAKTNQKPYAPQISSVSPSADSAVVSWTYQLLDPQDCEPASWSVRMSALGGAAQPAQPVRVVNGQNRLIFTGLRPATTYQAVVTAYISAQSTPSLPVTFTTTARGPDAPTSVQTTADGHGNWVVSWTPCTAANCLVPADTWTVVGTSCGLGYVGTPPTVQVPGSQTSVTISAATIGQLGNSLSFSVQGATVAGLLGDPTSDGSCTQAWAPPNPADLTLTAAGTPSGSTITATLQVSVASGVAPSAAYGSNGAQFTYTVGGQTVGPTSESRVTVSGLAPGRQYTPTVTVAPSGHPGTAVTITGQPFSENLPWPTLALSVPNTPDQNLDTGPVTATIGNLAAGPYMATNIVLDCGAAVQIPDTAVTSTGQVPFTVSLDRIGGTCHLSLVVVSTAAPNPYGVPSPQLTSGSFILGTPASPMFSMTATCQLLCPLPVTYTLSGANLPPPGAGLALTPTPNCAVSGAGPPWTVTCNDYNPPTVYATWSYLGVMPAPPPACAADCVAVGLTGTPPAPTTTTTTTTTSTTIPTTTTVPCPTSTSSTSSSDTTSTTACAPAGAPSPPPSLLAASVSPGAGGRALLDAIVGALVVASLSAVFTAKRRRAARAKGRT